MLNRLITNICSSKLLESKNFYTKLFDLIVQFDSDWFVQLASKDKRLEIGIIDKNSDLIPPEFQVNPNGFYLTFVVDNADAICEIARAEKFDIVSEPADTFYGQRRFLLKDPNGALIDVSSVIS